MPYLEDDLPEIVVTVELLPFTLPTGFLCAKKPSSCEFSVVLKIGCRLVGLIDDQVTKPLLGDMEGLEDCPELQIPTLPPSSDVCATSSARDRNIGEGEEEADGEEVAQCSKEWREQENRRKRRKVDSEIWKKLKDGSDRDHRQENREERKRSAKERKRERDRVYQANKRAKIKEYKMEQKLRELEASDAAGPLQNRVPEEGERSRNAEYQRRYRNKKKLEELNVRKELNALRKRLSHSGSFRGPGSVKKEMIAPSERARRSFSDIYLASEEVIDGFFQL